MLTQLGEGKKAKKVLVIVTGGTLIMKPSGTGGTLDVCPGFLSELLALPEWRHENLPDIDVLEWEVLTDSAMMGPGHWIKIAEDIESAYFRYDGFVVVHGTDTMAYSASALAFMLEDLGKPVVLTGSQIPLAEVYSDARNNLVSSLLFACRQDFQEVCIVFGSKLLRGCRTTKVHSFDLQAFASPNFPPLATLGVNLEFAAHLSLPPPRKAMRVHRDMDANLVVVRLVPGFEDDALFAMVNHSRHLHGIILLLYGTYVEGGFGRQRV
jgi:L-asparaginase